MIKQRDFPRETVSIIRMQKWGVREHLDDGDAAGAGHVAVGEYTEYVLDRRIRLPSPGHEHPLARHHEEDLRALLRSPDRTDGDDDLVALLSSGHTSPASRRTKCLDRGFGSEISLGFARLLGLAAAPNIIVGRCDDIEDKVLFDDGDEVMTEDARGMPVEINVADQMGTFVDYLNPLQVSAVAYADPVNRRIEYLPDPEGFAREYLDAFVEKFFCVQEKYRRRRKAFDTLFKNRPYNVDGSFAYRWEQVLKRLDRSDPRELAEIIQSHLQVQVACAGRMSCCGFLPPSREVE